MSSSDIIILLDDIWVSSLFKYLVEKEFEDFFFNIIDWKSKIQWNKTSENVDTNTLIYMDQFMIEVCIVSTIEIIILYGDMMNGRETLLAAYSERT